MYRLLYSRQRMEVSAIAHNHGAKADDKDTSVMLWSSNAVRVL